MLGLIILVDYGCVYCWDAYTLSVDTQLEVEGAKYLQNVQDLGKLGNTRQKYFG